MARHRVAYGHALLAARASPGGGTSRRRNAGDVLGSRRSGWRLYRERSAHRVAARAHGTALAQHKGRTRQQRRDREALRHADRQQGATFLAIGNGRRLIRAARHVARHFRHGRGSRHRRTAHRRGERSDDKPHDRKDREQSTEPYADLHWRYIAQESKPRKEAINNVRVSNLDLSRSANHWAWLLGGSCKATPPRSRQVVLAVSGLLPVSRAG